jgi:hypothetical protein
MAGGFRQLILARPMSHLPRAATVRANAICYDAPNGPGRRAKRGDLNGGIVGQPDRRPELLSSHRDSPDGGGFRRGLAAFRKTPAVAAGRFRCGLASCLCPDVFPRAMRIPASASSHVPALVFRQHGSRDVPFANLFFDSPGGTSSFTEEIQRTACVQSAGIRTRVRGGWRSYPPRSSAVTHLKYLSAGGLRSG